MAAIGGLGIALGELSGLGGGGSLGTLYVRLVADSVGLIDGMNRAVNSVSHSAALITRQLTTMGITAAASLTGLGVAAVNEFAKFETSFAGVKRTVDASEVELATMSQAFRDMAKEIPVNVNEINKVAEMAGTLGIAKEHVISFTRTMVDLGKVLPHISGEEAAKGLARIANVMKVPQGEFDRLASTLVALSREGASTEQEIINMSQRLAGAGVEIGMTAAEVMAMANSLSSVGIRAESGGTSMSRVMVDMATAVQTGNDQLKDFAKVAGMTTTDFSKMFRADAYGAILKFVEGLQTMSQEGGNTFGTLKELHFDGTRLRQALLGASNAQEAFSKSLRIGTTAYRENSALTEATLARYSTFASQLTITASLIRDMAITLGSQLAPHLLAVNKILQNSLKDTEGFSASVKGFVDVVVPGVLKGLGLIGDIFRGWRLIIKTGEVAFAGFGTAVGAVFENIVEFAALGMQELVDLVVGGLNMAIDAFNLLLPKAKELSKIGEVKLGLDTSDFEIGRKAFQETFKESLKELQEMAGEDSYFSKVVKSYEKVQTDVIEASKPKPEFIGPPLPPPPREVTRKVDDTAVARTRAESDIKAMHKEMFGEDGGKVDAKGRRKGRMFSGALSSFEDPAFTQGLELASEIKAAEDNLEKLQAIKDKEVGISEEAQKQKLDLIQVYNEKAKALLMAEAMFVFGTTSKMFGDMATMAEVWGGKQSAMYKTMFAASKAFAIAEAIVQIQMGIAKAFGGAPWPANLAAAAQVVAATANIVSTIASVTMEFGGGKAEGGPVQPGKIFLVGERGPELFIPNEKGTIIPNHQVPQTFDSTNRAAIGPVAAHTSNLLGNMAALQSQFPTAQAIDRHSIVSPATMSPIVTATTNILSTIERTKFGGMRESGGPVEAGATFVVGEDGPELFTPASGGNIIPNDELIGGESPIRVVVNNYTDARPEVRERREGGERIVEIILQKVRSELGSDIRDGRGEVNKALETSFNLRRGR